MSKRIPDEKRQQVIALHKQSVNDHKIAARTGVAYTSVRNIIRAYSLSKPKTEAMPSCYKLVGTFENATHTALLCLIEGFDSDVTGILCRKYKLHHDDLKDLAEWCHKNTVVMPKSSVQALESTVQDLKFSLDATKTELQQANLQLDEANAALAEYAKQQLIYERNERTHKSLLELQKKALAVF